jgi:hypothetical protein
MQDACYMIGYLSIFATLGMALFCTEGGDVYADSAACQTIGLPLLSMMDNLAPTLDHRTLLPLLVAFGPVRRMGMWCKAWHAHSPAAAAAAAAAPCLGLLSLVLECDRPASHALT